MLARSVWIQPITHSAREAEDVLFSWTTSGVTVEQFEPGRRVGLVIEAPYLKALRVLVSIVIVRCGQVEVKELFFRVDLPEIYFQPVATSRSERSVMQLHLSSRLPPAAIIISIQSFFEAVI